MSTTKHIQFRVSEAERDGLKALLATGGLSFQRFFRCCTQVALGEHFVPPAEQREPLAAMDVLRAARSRLENGNPTGAARLRKAARELVLGRQLVKEST